LDKSLDKAPDAFRTISEVADDLDLPQHVLRFWETRFIQIRPMKRGGGRRFYRREDIELLRGIRHLLYGEGYTIRGVQRILKDNGVKFVQTVWQAGAPQPDRLTLDAEPAAPGAAASEAPRGRGLFGILPSFRGGDAEADASPSAVALPRADAKPPGEDLAAVPPVQARGRVVPAPRAPIVETPDVETPSRPPVAPSDAKREALGAPNASAAVGSAGRLAPEDLRKLQATLNELGECRRLIDAALAEKP
jgi:DNA-binding transcriptional MerR regulator